MDALCLYILKVLDNQNDTNECFELVSTIRSAINQVIEDKHKEKEDIPESPVMRVNDEGEVKTDEELKEDGEEMAKQIKKSNKKKE